MIDPNDPYHQRKLVWDRHINKWRQPRGPELSDTQRLAELEYQNQQNQKLLKGNNHEKINN